MCSHQKMIPESMRIAVAYDNLEDLVRIGGYGNLFRGKHKGHAVAIKAIRLYINSDIEIVASVIAQFFLHSEIFLLNARFTEILQRSCSLETPTTPEHPTIAWRNFWG